MSAEFPRSLKAYMNQADLFTLSNGQDLHLRKKADV